jgi:hypothetical protein
MAAFFANLRAFFLSKVGKNDAPGAFYAFTK